MIVLHHANQHPRGCDGVGVCLTGVWHHTTVARRRQNLASLHNAHQAGNDCSGLRPTNWPSIADCPIHQPAILPSVSRIDQNCRCRGSLCPSRIFRPVSGCGSFGSFPLLVGPPLPLTGLLHGLSDHFSAPANKTNSNPRRIECGIQPTPCRKDPQNFLTADFSLLRQIMPTPPQTPALPSARRCQSGSAAHQLGQENDPFHPIH